MTLSSISLSIFTLICLFAATKTASEPDFKMSGFATTGKGTAGGTGGAEKTISTLQQLIDWGESREKNTTPEIVTIAGKITGSGDNTLITIKNGANITILGSGTSGELSGIGLNIRDYSNVIIKNLRIHEVRYPDDALTLDNVQQAWVDHCELYSTTGEGISTDTYDGLLDIKNGSSAITVSWCYLHDHIKCSLIGHTDNLNAQAIDSAIKVTYHHNYFVNTASRNPSIRYGTIHLFNNYFGNISDYGIASRNGAHVKIENCHYDNVLLPLTTDKFTDSSSSAGDKTGGFICEKDNLFTGTCGENDIVQTGCDYWNSSTLPYLYTPDDVATVKETVRKHAGFGNNPVVNIQAARVKPPSGSAVACPSKAVLAGKKTTVASVMAFDLRGRLLTSASLPGTRPLWGLVIIKQSPSVPGGNP